MESKQERTDRLRLEARVARLEARLTAVEATVARRGRELGKTREMVEAVEADVKP